VEATSQPMTAMPSQPSAMPTAVAQPSAAQYATSQGLTSPALNLAQPPAAAPVAPVYQQAVAPQASAAAPSAQAGNPWQEAFQALSASLNTSSPSQAPAQYSAYQTTPTPQQTTQANWGSIQQQQLAQAQYSAPQTYSQPASTQAYNQVSSRQQAPSRDAYLSQISDESLEVLEHFGAEAPKLLNQYACAVEDALIEQVRRGQNMGLMLEAAGEERQAMNIMLTDPDVLADYVNEFYGPNGPYPTPTEREQAHMQQIMAREQFEQEINAQEHNAVPQNFQRPQQGFPTPNRAQNPANQFWDNFGSLMDNNPEDAWKFLSQAPGQAFQQKMLVQDL